MSDKQLTTGEPVPEDGSHAAIDPATGQQKGYVVLSPEERARGFVRPVRGTYVHAGLPRPKHPLRDLTASEHARYDGMGYAKYEEYPPDDSALVGRFWTQAQLDKVDAGCKAATTMGLALAETYARDPRFYGSTFCCACRKHLPVAEFVWDGTDERVGS